MVAAVSVPYCIVHLACTVSDVNTVTVMSPADAMRTVTTGARTQATASGGRSSTAGIACSEHRSNIVILDLSVPW
jgi:hypothetical protein